MEFLGITARYSYVEWMNGWMSEWMMVIYFYTQWMDFEGRIEYDDARNIEIISGATVEHNIQFESYRRIYLNH